MHDHFFPLKDIRCAELKLKEIMQALERVGPQVLRSSDASDAEEN